MKKTLLAAAALFLLSVSFSFCALADSIPFDRDQLYAVAYLGYQETGDLDTYIDQYLDNTLLPVHYISDGEYYLIVPRYANTYMALYRTDAETGEQLLVYEDPECRPFLLQCNVSDIMADAWIVFSSGNDTAEFSPCISLMDGSVEVGEKGLLLGF